MSMRCDWTSEYLGDCLADDGIRLAAGRLVLAEHLEPHRERIETALDTYQGTCRRRLVPSDMDMARVQKWAVKLADSPSLGRDARAVLVAWDILSQLLDKLNGKPAMSRDPHHLQGFRFGGWAERPAKRKRHFHREMKARFGVGKGHAPAVSETTEL